MNKETNLQVKTADAVELMTKQADAQFALTPAGQVLKQFEIAQRMGQLFAAATIVPDVYKGNVANCAVAADMAMRMNLPPVMVMQNLYVVHGNPAWSSKFLIACINGCGRFAPLQYEAADCVPDADEYGYRCFTYAKEDARKENPLYGPWVTWKMVKAEGWLAKNCSKWKTMPELMFRYRAAAFWQRSYAPELAMGISTVEEAYDTPQEQPRPVDVEYKELSASAASKPAPVQIPEEQLAEALQALAAATTSDHVKGVKQNYKVVYDNNEMFRDAVIDQFSNFKDAEQNNPVASEA